MQSGRVVSLKTHLEITPPSSRPEKCVGGILRFHVSPKFCNTITDVHCVRPKQIVIIVSVEGRALLDSRP